MVFKPYQNERGGQFFMNIKVVYHSTTGRTRKLAKAIADTLGTKANQIEKTKFSFNEPLDILFIGSGIYGGKPHKKVISFIAGLNPDIIKNVAVFATYSGMDKIGADMKKRLKEKHLEVIGKPFICKGQAWLFINRNRPNEADLKEVRKYARSIVNKVSDKMR
jgi:flavodoxin I